MTNRKEHRTMNKDIRNSGERIATDFQALLVDAEGLLRAVSGASGEAMETARAQIQRRVDSLRRTLQDGQDSALGHARTAVGTADRYVHDNPWPIIGAALATGVILGVLARRGIDAGARGELH
jgi:ElaB/YqjD/DUF883 family membrane-anchored ribosome-binding protein